MDQQAIDNLSDDVQRRPRETPLERSAKTLEMLGFSPEDVDSFRNTWKEGVESGRFDEEGNRVPDLMMESADAMNRSPRREPIRIPDYNPLSDGPYRPMSFQVERVSIVLRYFGVVLDANTIANVLNVAHAEGVNWK